MYVLRPTRAAAAAAVDGIAAAEADGTATAADGAAAAADGAAAAGTEAGEGASLSEHEAARLLGFLEQLVGAHYT